MNIELFGMQVFPPHAYCCYAYTWRTLQDVFVCPDGHCVRLDQICPLAEVLAGSWSVCHPFGVPLNNRARHWKFVVHDQTV